MKKPWTVRIATRQDHYALARHRYFREAENQEDLTRYESWVSESIEAGRYIGVVAESNGEILGGAGLTVLEWGPTRGDPSPYRGRIVNVFVQPQWRRLGIAKEMLSKILDVAQERGLHTLSLAATSDSEQLYLQLGFAAYEHEMLRKFF